MYEVGQDHLYFQLHNSDRGLIAWLSDHDQETFWTWIIRLSLDYAVVVSSKAFQYIQALECLSQTLELYQF